MKKGLAALAATVAALVLVLACGGPESPAAPSETGGDGGTQLDGGATADAGAGFDAGLEPDAGAGDAGTAATSGSCKEASIDSCTDYAGKAAVIGEAKSRCAEGANTWSYSACATANRLGTCSRSDSWTGFGAVTIKSRYYKGAFWTATTAKADCLDFWQGTWSAP